MRKLSSRDEIAETLKQRVLSGLTLGILRHGDRLPSIRELAAEFEVEPRVILAACRRLEHLRLVDLRNRSGIYVAAPESNPSGAEVQHADWLVRIFVEALSRDIAGPSLPDRLRRVLDTLRLRAVVVDCNEDQLWSMKDELERDYGLEASTLDLEPPGRCARPRAAARRPISDYLLSR